MLAPPAPRRVATLTPDALRDALRTDARLLLPVGALTFGPPSLPVGAASVIVDHLADDLSAGCGILRAPTVNYGVTAPEPAKTLGATTVRKKTLHRLLNDLLSDWEAHGVDEFVLITAHRYDPHLEALATVITARARVRVVDALGVDCTDLLEAEDGSAREEEMTASLLLHLSPALVRVDRLAEAHAGPDPLPSHGGGSVLSGTGAWATADKGARLYDRIRTRIADRVLGTPQRADR